MKHINYTTAKTEYSSVFNQIRKSRWTKVVAFLLAVELLTGNLIGQHLMALTSGPSQPEAGNFQPASVSELVDPFTGDFAYNVPVMEIGGYPINLAYASGVTMDQEATWVGLGWNLNTGAITRNMRGLPDDFSGDTIAKEYNVKDNVTMGLNVGLGGEAFGFTLGHASGGFSFGIDMSYNNYTGFNMAQSFNPSISCAGPAKGNLNFGLGLTSSSGSGLSISPSVSFSTNAKKKDDYEVKGGLGLGLSMNSRSGLGSLSLDGSYSASGKYKSEVKNAKNEGKAESLGSSNLIGANLSFAKPSYVPQQQQSFTNSNLTFNAMVGIALAGGDIDLKMTGYRSKQALTDRKTSSFAYGYMYSENGQNSKHALHDFNREKDGSYTPKTTTKLAVTNYTYDVYQIQAQGLGGSIRPFRNDASYIYDKDIVSPSVSVNGGGEISLSQLIDGGINLNVSSVKSRSGMWEDANLAKNNMPFRARFANDKTERVHFRMAGEQTVDSDNSFYTNTGGDDAVRFSLDKLKLNNKLVKAGGGDIPFNGSISRQNRQNRVSSVEYLTVAEVRALYPHRAKYIYKKAKPHHIAQITVVKPDGTRYVFALPAYNKTQQEITFGVGTGMENSVDPTVHTNDNTVNYSATDNSIDNTKGIDHRYDKTTIPAYVHTWYLTEVLSPDYVDITGNGPTEDDLGNYTKFQYGNYNAQTGMYDPDIETYKWRTPTTKQPFRAGYNKNLHTDPHDDSANIIYGEKQIWYLHKIESKTQVCVFSLSDREDGLGVSGVNGGVNTAVAQKKIDKISLYAKEDWLAQEDPSTSYIATPVKVAHFTYNYELCPGITNKSTSFNSNLQPSTGKLTLKSVWFTFEKSGRAKYSPYTFDYSDSNFPSSVTNPSYDITANDKWGNYKKTPTIASDPTNAEFPYTQQDKATQDKYAQAWNLQKIGLPSGGIINVEYEADDYAYVQDRQACRMFKVVGSSSSATGTISNELFTPGGSNKNFLFFNLETPIPAGTMSATDAANYVRKKYFEGNTLQPNGPTKYLYFRFYVNVGSNPNQKEYVSGYADISSVGVKQVGSNYTMGYVELAEVSANDVGTNPSNPISKTAWQFSRLQTPRLAYHQTDPADDSFEGFMNTLAGSNLLLNIIQMFQGANGRLKSEGFGSVYDPQKSWIRLLEPDGIKLAGGHRVKSVEISDNWNTLTQGSEDEFSYGQEYSYKADDGTSSGVAAWEPGMGADENPFKTPIYMDKKVLMAPNEQFYIEEPMGESFFPSPTIGYAKVTVKNKQYTNVTVNGTGKVVHEFYTARDFPTKVKCTDLIYNRQKSGLGLTLLVNISFDKMAATQGYTVITNDMHGKAKREAIYDENETLITETTYDYKRNGDELNNEVDVINSDATVQKKLMGVDYDFIADMRQMRTDTRGAGAQINTALFVVGIIPIVIPSLFPDITVERTMFRSATATKVIFKTGILEKTTVYDKGAIVKTENKAYDARTGQVILTKVNNEFGKERYAVNFPAHWAYDRMGFAADNWGYWIKVPALYPETIWDPTTGKFADNATTDMLVPGDEVVQEDWRFHIPVSSSSNTANTNRLWVSEDDNGDKYLIKWDGNPFTIANYSGETYFKVIRSGRRNLATMGIGSMELMYNPISGGTFNVDNSTALNVSAQEYSEHWRMKLFRANVEEYTQVTCGANAVGTRMIMLINQLIDNNKFVRHYSTPLPSLDVNLTYGDYNLNGLLPSSPGTCEYYYTSLASGYTPPWGSSLGLTNNAWMRLVFTPKQPRCPSCDNFLIISLSNASDFAVTDFENIQYFSSVITIQNYMQLTGTNPYLYVVNNPDNVLIGRALMVDGTYKDFLFYSGCPEVLNIGSNCCDVQESYNCDLDIVNPYLYGLLGNWRPLTSYTYLTNRSQSSVSSEVNRRVDGVYSVPSYFWQKPTSPSSFWTKTLTLEDNNWRWAWTSEITNFNSAGGEVENVNPLNIYSSAVYGYKQTLPVIVAQNAKYKEIGFDGFEDYYSIASAVVPCIKEHFKLETDFWDYVSDEDAHTGLHSIKYNPSDAAPKFTYNTSIPQTRRTTPEVPYHITENDKLHLFSPDITGAGKKYILSFWVKKDGFTSVIQNYTDITASVKVGSTTVNVPASAKKSPVIDGWQQFEYEFEIPGSTASNAVEIKFNSTGSTYFIDDVRVHPFNATAKSFVYNAKNLRFMAELDENNYATFYEYDDEGALIRVKKETERGIMTLKENRNFTFKRNP